MNKAEALKKLTSLENEAKELRKIIECPGKITDRIKTFADVCQELGKDPLKVLPYPDPQSDDEKATNAFVKVSLIGRALNEGWKPNWDNSSEYKYYPWFDMRTAAGSGFSYSLYAYSATHTRVGSRLCFKSIELAMYAGKQFEAEFKLLLTLN